MCGSVSRKAMAPLSAAAIEVAAPVTLAPAGKIKIFNSVTDLIGRTPMCYLTKVAKVREWKQKTLGYHMFVCLSLIESLNICHCPGMHISQALISAFNINIRDIQNLTLLGGVCLQQLPNIISKHPQVPLAGSDE